MRGIAVVCIAMLALGLGQGEDAWPELTASAREFVTELAEGRYEDAVARFDAVMARAMPAATLKSVWEATSAKAGGFQQLVGMRSEKAGRFRVVEKPHIQCIERLSFGLRQ